MVYSIARSPGDNPYQQHVKNWNSDFTFVGTQSLEYGRRGHDLRPHRQRSHRYGLGQYAHRRRRSSGSGYSLTKAGSGTLVLGGSNS